MLRGGGVARSVLRYSAPAASREPSGVEPASSGGELGPVPFGVLTAVTPKNVAAFCDADR